MAPEEETTQSAGGRRHLGQRIKRQSTQHPCTEKAAKGPAHEHAQSPPTTHPTTTITRPGLFYKEQNARHTESPSATHSFSPGSSSERVKRECKPAQACGLLWALRCGPAGGRQKGALPSARCACCAGASPIHRAHIRRAMQGQGLVGLGWSGNRSRTHPPEQRRCPCSGRRAGRQRFLGGSTAIDAETNRPQMPPPEDWPRGGPAQGAGGGMP